MGSGNFANNHCCSSVLCSRSARRSCLAYGKLVLRGSHHRPGYLNLNFVNVLFVDDALSLLAAFINDVSQGTRCCHVVSSVAAVHLRSVEHQASQAVRPHLQHGQQRLPWPWCHQCHPCKEPSPDPEALALDESEACNRSRQHFEIRLFVSCGQVCQRKLLVAVLEC